MKLYMPLMDETLNEKNNPIYAKKLKECGADSIFLAVSRIKIALTQDEQVKYFTDLKKHYDYFKSQGYEVGIWISGYGFGAADYKFDPVFDGEPRITNIEGRSYAAFCPEGDKIVEYMTRHVKNIAEIVNPDMIMFDDDMCLSVRPGLGCFCDKHMALYKEKFGREFTREELKTLIFTGNNHEYRKAWLDLCGDSHRKFCQKMRDTVDKVNPSIRMGFCSGFTSWDVEGADALELTKILAGSTKPFLRFTGAPYWTCPNWHRFPTQQINSVIEYARMQYFWSKGLGIDVFAECDSFPRHRFLIPASVCEGFDLALAASENMDSLKYLFCYDADPDYETGYVKNHLRNRPMVNFFEKRFADKKAVGVKVYEKMRQIEHMDLGETFQGEGKIMTKTFSPAANLLTSHGIPTVYDGDSDIGIAFGENAKYVDKLPKKLIIDLGAAEILQSRGIDVGLERSDKNITYTTLEQFGDNMPISINPCGQTRLGYAKDGVTVKSNFIINDKIVPSAYVYKNGDTEFLVFTFDAYQMEDVYPLALTYYRQSQLLDFIGSPYPVIKGVPGVYTVCKDGENERAVAFINLSYDKLFDFEVELNDTYSQMELFGAEGTLLGNKVKITSMVASNDAFAMILKS